MKIFSTLLSSFILFSLLTVCITGVPLMAQSQAPAFLSVIDDLPLMPGLLENAGGALIFDTANGRIAENIASGPVEVGAVTDYYARTLPQLGWKLETLDRYIREGEVLSIDIDNSNGDSTQAVVHFRLSPTGTK
jgi:hypothetical protein